MTVTQPPKKFFAPDISETIRAKRWLATFASMVCLGTVLLVWGILERQGQAHIERTSNAMAVSVRVLIEQDLEERIAVLKGLAQRWRSMGGADRSIWMADARSVFGAHPGLRAVERIDRSLHVRWVEPISGNESVVGLSLNEDPVALAMVEKARSAGVAASPPTQLVGGKQGMVFLVPTFVHDGFDGLMAGVLEFEGWLETLLAPVRSGNHYIEISVDNQTIYSSGHGMALASEKWGRELSYSVADQQWQIHIVPSASYIARTHAWFSYTLLVTGILLSAFVYPVVMTGITNRQWARELLDASQQLEVLFNSLPGMSYRGALDYPWPMEFVSNGCKELCGFDKADLERKRVLWGELIHPEDRARVTEQVNCAVSSHAPFDMEYRILVGAGVTRWVWERGAALADADDGELMLEGFITDITDRKHTESRLIEAQAYSESVLGAAQEAIINIGADDGIKGFNQEAEAMFGYEAAEAVGMSMARLIPDSYLDEHREYIRYFNETGSLKYLVDRREMKLRRKDGSLFPVQVSVAGLQHPMQRQFVCLVWDMSSQYKAEQEAKDHLEKLAHVSRLNMLGEMTSGIAHELNQPLTAISLFSQVGKRLYASGKPEKLPEIFDKLSAHTQRAGSIIKRIQSMSRQHFSQFEIVDCNGLMREVASLAEAEARIRDIEVVTQLEDKRLPASVDSIQIQQVALNLLRNGMEAMRAENCRHGNVIRLQTRLLEADTVEVAVIDSGGGVADAIVDSIFTPFSTTKTSGMGIGLSISKSIVTAHGGHINYENRERFGAIFSFTLPLALQGEDHEPAADRFHR
ncbi:PAS domain S-box protein [Marinobacter sp. F3R11]|uniref:PAS domain S-box protein n=1 Tax=Marinobacter sp. F3R11 TaxID=2267231 RepID=UPI000DEA931A|nr:PAS domain S-box protein [Marinobacter sp. F3R11]RBW48065.1 hypothetical protein DS878_15410 [Marinobacter sp. F3R11]